MLIAVGVIGDGRAEYLEQAIASLEARVGVVAGAADIMRIMVNDSGDADYAYWLESRCKGHWGIIHHPERRGLAGAVRSLWTAALDRDADFLFHVEEDFVFHAHINLTDMAAKLDDEPLLAQLVLKRNPWSAEERSAGGQIEVAPEDYTDEDGFVSHRRLYSFNPHLAPARTMSLCVATPGDGLERGFTDTLLANGYRFAYWGGRHDPPRCEHVGHRRSAGYRW